MRSPYFPARTVLFHKEPNGVTYRVPALLYLSRSRCFLAFCEQRLSPSDSQAHLLVMRKGTFYRNYVEWGDVRVLSTALLPGHRSMNPCPVYDEFTGTLFLFFIAILGHTSESYQLRTGKNLSHLCFICSTDEGETWSPVTDLTKKVIGDTIKEWATFALGPGHGIQLKSGRLLIPAYSYHIDCRECFGQLCLTTPHAFCFHSDNHGRTWRFGEAVPGPESVECQVVSVDEEDWDQCVVLQRPQPSWIQGAGPQPGRWSGLSGGAIGAAAGGAQKWLPCWRGPWVIYEGPSAYSDLAYLELPTSPGSPPVVAFACLFECGPKTAYDEICFCIFTLYELIDNLPQNGQQRNCDGARTSQSRSSGSRDAQRASVGRQGEKEEQAA
ncbi:hypothetical protein fugu_011153 [Takifugu bimaculatus]|uniref:exo-alpha-sialidase n=1 Tax=Takifugu bimaculatus TaxID=433685 RepID=A0A4Z2CC95_9TELE|nr:hypothetical protein fugu_011153 [Takifugu bimaculatus]